MAALSVESLSKSFGSLRAVDDLSLTVERGQLFGLLGPNGSGKSTTLACALGLMRPDRGRSSVLDVPSRHIARTAGRLAAVFDTTDLVDGLTARQNLDYTLRLLGHSGGRGPDEALELVGLAGRGQQRAGKLSLGQKRRLSIARALLGRPEFLVLDEPLSGLDALGVNRMLELFSGLADDGLTLLLSSHRLHEMERIVSHAAIIAGGKLLCSGTLDELLTSQEGRVRVVATPLDRATDLLSAMDGVTLTAPERPDEIVVLAPGISSSTLNRTLLESGCEVSALIPERATLPGLFTSLVDPA